ncbi:hypothetical protein NDU88_003039 [Pleurodeles waltl]|uniref:Uncharacterized protein n=1 Tax=Pleurodeles waltl TaxID=8319 RepID=A0AAV7VEB9_PLEWA|nr:hypothetical protein NDU88_003039 [Pleurodeles waltl]
MGALGPGEALAQPRQTHLLQHIMHNRAREPVSGRGPGTEPPEGPPEIRHSRRSELPPGSMQTRAPKAPLSPWLCQGEDVPRLHQQR